MDAGQQGQQHEKSKPSNTLDVEIPKRNGRKLIIDSTFMNQEYQRMQMDQSPALPFVSISNAICKHIFVVIMPNSIRIHIHSSAVARLLAASFVLGDCIGYLDLS